MWVIFGYIAAVVTLICAIMISRVYMHKNRRVFVKGAPSNTQKGSFFTNQYGLVVLIMTPILFGAAWFIGWMISR